MSGRPALLALEDGVVFRGRAVGASGEATGEVVFNTAMTGYQEILTDPSYAGQLVCLTYPLIGNYGVNEEDPESRQPWTRGLIVRELAARHSNWRATGDLGSYLRAHGIVAIDEVDTRALTRHLRLHGAKTGVISTTDLAAASLTAKARRAPKLGELDLVREVAPAAIAPLPLPAGPAPGAGGHHVVAIDAGAKRNIMRNLAARGCRVTVVPATASAPQIAALEPDGLFLSNGPGDPEQAPYLADTVRELLAGRRDRPVFGICLGLQIMALALGAEIFKLKFGHHGANHPVREERTGVVSITSQNHGYAVAAESLPPELRVTHVNLNDGTIEGLEHRARPLFAIQYHPEAAPGPHDARHLFDRFVEAMERAPARSRGAAQTE